MTNARIPRSKLTRAILFLGALSFVIVAFVKVLEINVIETLPASTSQMHGKWFAFACLTTEPFGSRIIVTNEAHSAEYEIYMVPNIAYNPLLHKAPVFGQVAWSPDGESIAFIIDDQLGLYTFSEGKSSVQMNVVNNVVQFSWSPDSEHIALIVSSGINELHSSIDYGLYIYALSDSSLRYLVSSNDGVSLAWSPTSEWIAFSSENSIRLISPDGIRSLDLVQGTSSFIDMAWSPDGVLLAYYKRIDLDESVIRIVDISTLLQIDISIDRYVYGLSWSDDGQWISFSSRDPDNRATGIYRVQRDTNEMQQLTAIDDGECMPSGATWSPPFE